MDKSVILIFLFAAIILVSLIVFLLVLGGGSARSRTVIKGTGREVKSKYRATQRALERRIYPPPLRRNRRP